MKINKEYIEMLVESTNAAIERAKALSTVPPKVVKDYGAELSPMAAAYIQELATRFARGTIKYLYVKGDGLDRGCNEKYLELWDGFQDLPNNPESMDLVQVAALNLLEQVADGRLNSFSECTFDRGGEFWSVSTGFWVRREACKAVRSYVRNLNSRKRGQYNHTYIEEWNNEKGECTIVDVTRHIGAIVRGTVEESYISGVMNSMILTGAEKAVFRLAALGYGSDGIAEKLGRKRHTVNIQLQSIRAKLKNVLWDEYLRQFPETDYDEWAEDNGQYSAARLWKAVDAELAR